jgi:UDP-2,3-diacylglucosamine hydrolase
MPASYLEIHQTDLRFLADTHFRDPLDDSERERRRRFLAFLDSLQPDSALFLLGDIFDFYFEYRHVVSNRYLDVYAGLSRTTARGVEVHFLGGNHDFWVGDFARRELGMRVHQDEIRVSAQGRRVVCAHGDLVVPRDWGYKILKTVLRNRAVIAAARWVHPDLFDALATGVSYGSRAMQATVAEERARAVASHAHRHFFARGNDAFVMGHIHHPLVDTRDGRDFVILGDWISDFTYARLCGGSLTLETFVGS